jgi:alpha/beta superfamily hydrolase
MEKVKFLSGDREIVGVLHSSKDRGACVITCHGLQSDKDSEKYIEIANRFLEDFSVLRFDFGGCGESEGDKLDLSGRKQDLKSAIAFVKDLGIEGVGLLGSSLGGYLSILIATEEGIRAVVTWSTPVLEDAKEAIKQLNCPIMIIHGSMDELVPTSHAEELYKNAREPKRLKMEEGADHRFTDPCLRKEAIELSLNWFRQYL